MGKPRFDDAHVHLHVLGRERELTLRVRVGECSLTDLLPVARAISEEVTRAAVEHAAAAGEVPSCRRGCDACCRHLVPIAPAEALALADRVASLPSARRRAVRRRFSRAIQRMEELGMLAKGPPGRSALTSSAGPGASAWDDVSRRYFDAKIDCPLLEGAACSMYEERPAICREYLVVSPPSSCDSLDGGSRAVERPIRMSEVLVGLGNEHSGAEDPSVPLPLALEWAETHGRRLRAQVDGEALYWMLMRHVEDAE